MLVRVDTHGNIFAHYTIGERPYQSSNKDLGSFGASFGLADDSPTMGSLQRGPHSNFLGELWLPAAGGCLEW
jgi:hypothetical protein